MNQHPHLSKAPITEAIIEFAVVAREAVTVEDLSAVKRRLESTYGTCIPLYHFEGRVTFDAATGETRDKTHDKWHIGFRSEARAGKLVTFTLESMSFHKLAPYSSWKEVFGEAWQTWESYRRDFRPETTRRIAARYINRLELPVPTKLEEYVAGPPPLAGEYAVAGYVKRVNIREKKTNLLANVIQALEVPPAEETGVSKVVIILDNDVYTTKAFDPSDDSKIKTAFEQIHGLKNRLFYESITNRVVEEYK